MITMTNKQNLKFLEEQIKKNTTLHLKESISKNIPLQNYIKNTLLSEVQKTVYDSYLPKVYNRRKEDNGLKDPNNVRINTKISKNMCLIEIDNIAKPTKSLIGTEITSLTTNNHLLADWIEFGRASDKLLFGTKTPYTRKRPFMENTKYDLLKKDEQIRKLVTKGMR